MAKLDLKLESLISKYERISDAMETGAATKHALNYLGEQAIASVKKATPVRSGTLRREWKLHNYTGRNYIVVANNTDYALYVEKGHRVVSGGRTSGFVPPTKMGYVFLGYALDSVDGTLCWDANGKSLVSKWTRLEDAILYAIWEAQGLVNIHDGTKYRKAISYINDGVSYKRAILWIHDGTKYRLGG